MGNVSLLPECSLVFKRSLDCLAGHEAAERRAHNARVEAVGVDALGPVEAVKVIGCPQVGCLALAICELGVVFPIEVVIVEPDR